MKNVSLKSRLIAALLVLVMMVTTLIGSTYAWFTDSVTSAGNKIEAGSLKVDLVHLTDSGEVSLKRQSNHKIFDYDKWEPGYTRVETLEIRNDGSLALKYRLSITIEANTATLADSGEGLADVIDVYVTYEDTADTSYEAIKTSPKWTRKGTLTQVLQNPYTFIDGTLLAEGSQKVKIALHMQESAGNVYQNLSVGNLFVTLVATQTTNESDSFGPEYDNGATFPDFAPVGGISVNVQTNNNVVTADATVSGDNASAKIPAGVSVNNGVNKLTFSVKPMTATSSNVVLDDGQDLLPVDVHVEGVSPDNTTPIIVTLNEIIMGGLNIGNYDLYHVEDGVSVAMTRVASIADLDSHNEYYYDPATGDVSLAMATFSEVALVADTENAWEGKFDYTWYDASKTELTIANADQLAAFGAIVGGMAEGIKQDSFEGKTVKLIADINLGDKESENNPDLIFYPIGYNSSDGKYEKTGVAVTTGFYNFSGIFDGNGNTIANFYHNTWEMKGDHNWYAPEDQYYRDGMGLFGKVYGGTIKNLTVDNFSSDGEIATTGVIAAYADGATFENIAITNCNPRVYNIGNGGIVGCVGWYAKEANLKTTFKNITVDNSNKISALWGSYDVACGGIVGQYYPTSGQTSAGTPANGGIDFVNCHISAQMDVYNDVCGNYQYYAYRYTGMLIGSVRENVTIDGHSYPKMDGITAEGCTVHFGTWNDYYYCEFEKNGHPSYSGPDDYKFSRVPNEEIDTSNGKENATCIGHNHTEVEDNQAVYLPFNNLVTGYGWGVTTKVVGELEGVKILDREVADSVEKFETKFTGGFLYRVGNQNAVSLGSLFAAKNGVTISDSGVWVKVEKLDENMNVSGTFTANTADWTKGTIQFSGTGVVKVTIQDYNFCTPTVLYLEVVDAKNATTALSTFVKDSNGKIIEEYNVVLLNDISGGFDVSNGYSFYGNGFKVTCSGKGYSLNTSGMSLGYINVQSGTLDNVQVYCDIYPVAFAYASEVNVSSNEDTSLRNDDKKYYNYQLSAVAVNGNSTISNCYIYGARNNILVASGNVTIENTVTECGSLSNIHVNSTSNYTVSLRDITTIQYLTQSKYDTSNKVMGFGVLIGNNESESNAKIVLEGDLRQYNWVTSGDTDISNTYAKTAITEALKVGAYQYTIDNNTTVNMGIAVLNSKQFNYEDNRINKEDYPYELNDITMLTYSGQVYSIKSGANVNANNRYNHITDGVIPYVPTTNGVIAPSINHSGTNESSLTISTKYNNEWVTTFTADLDNISGGSYTFKFNDLIVKKNGVDLTFTVKDSNGNTVDKNAAITLNQLMSNSYTLVVTDNQIYGADGELTGKSVTHEMAFVLYATKTSIEPPKFTGIGSGVDGAIRLVSSSGGNWRPAYPALEGVFVEYWSASEGKTKTVDLSTLTSLGTISGQTWTYTCDDYTLKITGGPVHSTTSYVLSPMIATRDEKQILYFAGANKDNTTGTTARLICLEYVFTDKNASTTVGQSTKYSDGIATVQYANLPEFSWSSFQKGTVEAVGSDDSCVTGDTLVTLADGTQKRIDEISCDDILLVWDFNTGDYAYAPASIIWNHGDAEYNIASLKFSDGTVVKMINSHGFFDVDANNFVYITQSNVSDYLGHKFVKADGDSYTTVTLVDYSIEREYSGCYSIQTAVYNNFIVENMFSMTTPDYEGWFDYFNITDDMKYDEEHMRQEIEKYGLCSYEEISYLGTYEQYVALNAQYLNILIGRGVVTMDEVIAMLQKISQL